MTSSSPPLPASMLDAFGLAAAELGMFSAARLFCQSILAEGGDVAGALLSLQRLIGPTYPVVDVVASSTQAHLTLPSPSADAIAAELDGLKRVIVIGTEAWILDSLRARLPSTVGLSVVIDTTLPADATRIAANFEGRAELIGPDDVIARAGARVGLITAVYGCDGFKATVCSAWLRVMGPDTRTLFGSLLGWDLLGAPMDAYPRWLRETTVDDFSAIVSGACDDLVDGGAV